MHHRIALRARANQHYVYSGRSVLVTNLDGAVTGSGTEGFYFANTRLLSRDELTADGRPLTPVAATPVSGAGFLAYAEVPAGPNIPQAAVYIAVQRAVDDGMRTVLRIENYTPHTPARFNLAFHLAADFADTEEAESGERQQTAAVETAWSEPRQELTFRYCHPALDRAVAIRVERAPGPVRFEEDALVIALDLAPHQPVELHLVVEPIFDGKRHAAPKDASDATSMPLGRVRQRLRAETPTLTATNATVAKAWETATADLASLPLGLPEGPATPMAGLPLYQQFFGRDSLTIGWQALLAMPTLLRDALRANAAWQGTKIDDWLDEEPGKMIHQARWGPLSVLGVEPFIRYYGDYATPPDFLLMLSQYLAWTDDRETVRALLPAARAAVTWLERYGDMDGDGFLEYVARSEKGVKNQGWKDSDEAIIDERGTVVENPIAASELQAYWYAALQLVAIPFFVAGDRAYALELLGKARALQRRFDRAFWMEEEGYYALALGPNKEQIRSIASNAGHLLAAGIVPRSKGVRVARRLMQPDMFSGWGIRTLSSDHVAYNPFSYHLGSVWPVENGTIALGFARYGCWEELHRLAEGVFASTELFVANRLPEAIGGLPRDARYPHPGIYPKSCEPQGWSASMVVLLIQSLLGMRAAAPLHLLLVDPHLPEWLPDLRLEGVRVGRTSVDLAFWRGRCGATHYRVLKRDGPVRALRQPVPQGPEASLAGRARAIFTS
jgi:glycogen debranching enzyme